MDDLIVENSIADVIAVSQFSTCGGGVGDWSVDVNALSQLYQFSSQGDGVGHWSVDADTTFQGFDGSGYKGSMEAAWVL